MKFISTVIVASSLLTLSVVDGSFLRDVVRDGDKIRKQDAIENALLSKATPLAEYKAKLEAQGLDFASESSRYLEDGNDDYYMDENNKYSFEGFSLKYARCQPVQRFSEDAIKAGEYTPMVTDDIVILRLCPYRFCSSSRTFGCHYNYAEYAIGMSDYIRVMLRYKMDKQEQLCDWCDTCYARRQLEENDSDENDEGEEEQQQEGDEEEEGQEENDEEADEDEADDDEGNDDAQQQNNAAAGDDNQWWGNGDDYYANDACYNYETYCNDDDGYTICQDNGDDGSYLGTEDYLDYLDCVQVNDADNYAYYVRPRCDGYKETIKMALYYDSFCSQYAGNDVSLKNFGLGFQESFFEDIYTDPECLQCSESNIPPYFNANSNMCNKMHATGPVCANNLQYDIFEQNGTGAAECSYIESVRYGTYDEEGRLFGESTLFGADRTVTKGQKYGVAFALGICGILAVYSCYLHHSITNLLIKSLSHTDLLPPSRSRRSSRNYRSRSRGRRKRVTSDDDEEWEMKGTPA